jgi:hypothetical protein
MPTWATCGDNLFEHTEQFRAQGRLHDRKASQVAAWMRETHHQAIADRIATGNEDDRDSSGRLLRGLYRRIAIGQHHVRRLAQHLRNGRPHPIGVARAPVKIDLKTSTQPPAGLFYLAPEHGGAKLALRILLGIQHEDADPTSLAALLRARRQRPTDG